MISIAGDAERDGIHVNLKDYLAHVRVSSIGTRPWRRHTGDELRKIYAPKQDNVAATNANPINEYRGITVLDVFRERSYGQRQQVREAAKITFGFQMAYMARTLA